MNTVERVKYLCKTKKIAISKLEKDLGYANGYIGQLKKGSLPDDRLKQIADYLKVSSYWLSTGINENILFSDENAMLELEVSNDTELMEHLKKYINLTDDSKKRVLDEIDFLYNLENK